MYNFPNHSRFSPQILFHFPQIFLEIESEEIFKEQGENFLS
jgi:hypothetical protein